MQALLLAAAMSAAPCSDCEELQGPHYDTTPVPSGQATNPEVSLTAVWLAMQLVPSPGLALGDEGPHLRLSWQLTPLLYSFAMDPRLRPWRSFVVEPIVRQSGSIELYVSPEYVAWPERFGDRWGYRVGVRSTFGVVQRGDYLSVGIGTGFLDLAEGQSAEYELGAYLLFGLLGLTVQWAPSLESTVYTSTLRFRWF